MGGSWILIQLSFAITPMLFRMGIALLIQSFSQALDEPDT